MKTPWGVKKEIGIAQIDEYQAFLENNNYIIVDDKEVNIIKFGIKERNGIATLIYRYQLTL